LRTDEEAEHFIDTADLSEYDFSTLKPTKFELRKKDARVNMRLPETLLRTVKSVAAEEQVPYQRLMRDLIERGLAARAESKAASPKTKTKTKKAS
jgi:predicted DNA binding CopG/RHH family protein